MKNLLTTLLLLLVTLNYSALNGQKLNLLSETECRQADSTGKPGANSTKTTYTYTTDGKPSSVTEYHWNGKMYLEDFRTSYSYAGGNAVRILTEVYDSAKATWVEEGADSFLFDLAGRQVRARSLKITSGKYTPLAQTMTYYDPVTGRDTLIHNQTFSGGAWQESDQLRSTYNSAGMLLSQDRLTWDRRSRRFIFDTRKEFTYNASGSLVTLMESGFDTSSGFYGISFDTLLYNGQGRLSRRLNYFLSGTDRTASTRHDFVYDASGQTLKEETFGWNGSAFYRDMRREDTYNTTGQRSTSLERFYDVSTNQFNTGRYCTYTYTILSALWAEDRSEQKGIRLFPQPAIEDLNVLLPENFGLNRVQLLGMDGRLIRTEKQCNKGQLRLEVGMLPAGAYLLRLEGANEGMQVPFLKR